MLEKERVRKISESAEYGKGVMTAATEYCGQIFRRYMKVGSVLELGPAEGIMTDILIPYFDDYTIVDGADFFVSKIRERHPKIEGWAKLFEEFIPLGNKKYDNIILGHVLEHVESPIEILKRCASWLSEGRIILAAVPNAHSVHRQAAVLMGMLHSENQLNETDIKNGHRRVYNTETLRCDFVDSGLKIVSQGGYWIKPESNSQIDQNWTDEMIEAFLRMGEQYPEIAAEIYIVATK